MQSIYGHSVQDTQPRPSIRLRSMSVGQHSFQALWNRNSGCPAGLRLFIWRSSDESLGLWALWSHGWTQLISSNLECLKHISVMRCNQDCQLCVSAVFPPLIVLPINPQQCLLLLHPYTFRSTLCVCVRDSERLCEAESL